MISSRESSASTSSISDLFSSFWRFVVAVSTVVSIADWAPLGKVKGLLLEEDVTALMDGDVGEFHCIGIPFFMVIAI